MTTLDTHQVGHSLVVLQSTTSQSDDAIIMLFYTNSLNGMQFGSH